MNPLADLLKVKADLVLKNSPRTITEHEVADVLGNELPEINQLLEKTGTANIYKVMQAFADFTRQLAFNGNLKEVKHCFNLAEKMLLNGNGKVKNAVENAYLFSVSKLLDMAGPISEKVKGLLSGGLKKEYMRQICASGL